MKLVPLSKSSLVQFRLFAFRNGRLNKMNACVYCPIPEKNGLLVASYLEQWYSTGGKRRHLRGYVKFKISIYILFPE
jgi:hypothetical protein